MLRPMVRLRTSTSLKDHGEAPSKESAHVDVTGVPSRLHSFQAFHPVPSGSTALVLLDLKRRRR